MNENPVCSTTIPVLATFVDTSPPLKFNTISLFTRRSCDELDDKSPCTSLKSTEPTVRLMLTSSVAVIPRKAEKVMSWCVVLV